MCSHIHGFPPHFLCAVCYVFRLSIKPHLTMLQIPASELFLPSTKPQLASPLCAAQMQRYRHATAHTYAYSANAITVNTTEPQLASLLCAAQMQRYRHATAHTYAYSVNDITVNTTKPLSYKSVTRCIAIQFNNSRNHFSQMLDMFWTLRVALTVSQNLLIPSSNSALFFGFTSLL